MTHASHAHAQPYLPMPIAPLDNMPSLLAREQVGLELRRARKAAEIETAQAAQLAGISVSQLGAIERGTHSLTSVSAGNLSRLPAAFGLTWEKFVNILRPVYGSYIRLLPRPDAQSQGFDPAPMAGYRRIANRGSVMSGLNPSWYILQRPDMYNLIDHPDLEDYQDEDLFTVAVQGDSMVCAEVQNHISVGSTAVFHNNLDPQPGDIVAIWLEDEKVGALRVYDPKSEGHIILAPYDLLRRPIILGAHELGQVQGVYLTHIAPIRRRR